MNKKENSGVRIQHYRAKIIPIFLPHQGCANRCIFCNQKEVTGTCAVRNPQEVYPLIQHYLGTIERARQKKQTRHGPLPLPLSPGGRGQGEGRSLFPDRIEVAFYGGNFTGMPAQMQREFLQPAALEVQKGTIDGVRISTRPDYISRAGLQFLAGFGVSTVEIGVQSLEARVLQRAGRTYSEDQVAEAMSLLHQGQFFIGLHLMVGLPEETLDGLISTVEQVIRLAPHFVRIHPTLVIKDTELEKMYRRGDYTPLTLEQAVEVCKELSRRLNKGGIPVARIGLQSIPEMQKSGCVVAGPFHPALGELVASSIAYDRMRELLQADPSFPGSPGRAAAKRNGQGERARAHPVRTHPVRAHSVVILVPERELSIFIGQHRQNLLRLQQQGYGYQEISIVADKNMEPGSLRCMENQSPCVSHF